MKLKKLGIIINPIAGLGAELAWKGTDDVEAAWNEIDKGITPPVWKIAKRAINSLQNTSSYIFYYGGSYSDFPPGNVIHEPGVRSSRIDTIETIQSFIDCNVDLIIFIGGDGTASDIASLSLYIPVIGVPAGVKIFSSCFLHTPEQLGSFLDIWNGETKNIDILDLDEEEYRNERAVPQLKGSILIPISEQIQMGKVSFATTTDNHTFELISDRIIEDKLLQGKLCFIGPGSTMKGIFNNLGMEISLLGLDVVEDGKIVQLDCSTIELKKYAVDEIWLTPIGQQGHILGRGNKQLNFDILEGISKNQIKIFSTPDKLNDTPLLYVDTGNQQLNKKFQGYYSLITGYYEEVMRKCI